ncbi:MAG TPA: S-layer homology domain-containing protein [Candidatus Acutalibacter stercorigallinarum]|nr:S-layer homology domain-containing protein [Candidatus Acutalibacter stercorigallinarum]
MTVDISAKYNVIATTADDPEDIELESTKPGTSKNAVILKPNQDMKVTSPVTITLPLPNGFVTSAADKVYVQHKGYEYEATVTETEEEPNKTYTATFTNPHGFSTFVLSTDSKTVATVNGTDYTNFQQAVNAAGPSDTITVKQNKNNLAATGVNHDLKLENGTSGPITVTINGEKITIPAYGQAPFTYTPPTPPRPTEEKHSITISTDGKGQVTGPASAAEDDKVTLTVKPNADKELYDLKVTDEDGKAIAVTKVNDTTYTFTMPDGKVTIAATFGCDGGDNCPSKAFTDLGDKQWYHDSIDYAVENGLLEGTSPTTMEPNATLIRAQLAQILYNIEDKPAVTGEMVFEDVPASEWFYSPVLWANQNEIINGTSPTTFEPLEDISRQDLALMLYRYAGKPAVTGDLDGFTDAEQVGDWAEEAMAWAVDEGIVQGDTPTTLNPTGTATRAEAAAMLQRFLENAA